MILYLIGFQFTISERENSIKHKLTALLFIGLFPLNILHAKPISLECTSLDITYVSVMHINLDPSSEHVSVEYSGRQDTIKYLQIGHLSLVK